MNNVTEFPSTKRGEKRMAVATIASAPSVFTMARPSWPLTCGDRQCAHPMCLRARWHWQIRACGECHIEVLEGERYIMRNGEVVHFHDCPTRTP